MITDFGLAVQLMAAGQRPAPGSALPSPSSSSSAASLQQQQSFQSMVGGSRLDALYSTLWTSPRLALSVFISPPEVSDGDNPSCCMRERAPDVDGM